MDYNLLEPGTLGVTISDSGIGIREGRESNARPEHKSVGMTITRKRLEMMSRASSVRLVDLAEESGGAQHGTRVELRIALVGNNS